MKAILPNPPTGYKAEAEWRSVRPGDHVLRLDGSPFYVKEDNYHLLAVSKGDPWIVLTPDIRKYDWSKTADYALVSPLEFYEKSNVLRVIGKYSNQPGDFYGKPLRLTDDWLHHFGGPCPFDAESVIVEVVYRDGVKEIRPAANFVWGHHIEYDDIIAVRFVRLVEGVEW